MTNISTPTNINNYFSLHDKNAKEHNLVLKPIFTENPVTDLNKAKSFIKKNDLIFIVTVVAFSALLALGITLSIVFTSPVGLALPALGAAGYLFLFKTFKKHLITKKAPHEFDKIKAEEKIRKLAPYFNLQQTQLKDMIISSLDGANIEPSTLHKLALINPTNPFAVLIPGLQKLVSCQSLISQSENKKNSHTFILSKLQQEQQRYNETRGLEIANRTIAQLADSSTQPSAFEIRRVNERCEKIRSCESTLSKLERELKRHRETKSRFISLLTNPFVGSA
ncbi:MAG: hypothetical protein MRY21_01955 [Simkaniaceae bacterium]|nr:hypothetical protein [Simkaniaceae bacterium]